MFDLLKVNVRKKKLKLKKKIQELKNIYSYHTHKNKKNKKTGGKNMSIDSRDELRISSWGARDKRKKKIQINVHIVLTNYQQRQIHKINVS